MGELGEIGYYLRIDAIQPDKKIEQAIGSTSMTMRKDFKAINTNKEKIKQPLFQFRFDSECGRFVRELKEFIYIDNAIKDPNFVDGSFVTPNYLDFDQSPRTIENPSEKVNIPPKNSNDENKIDVSDVKIEVNTTIDATKDNIPLNTSVITEY